jgi:hypothetical protein
VRRQLLHESRFLGKWETLAFLLPLMETEDEAVASVEIDRWMQSANRQFTAPESAMRGRLEAALRVLQSSNPSPRWAYLLGILAHS